MTATRQSVLDQLWLGSDPFADTRAKPDQIDYQGWASDNPVLHQIIDRLLPTVVIEVGVWKGGSVITMAERLKEHSLNAVVIAIDTWLGASEHWLEPAYRPSLRLEGGYPTLYRTFAANIVSKGLAEYVVPLPLDSLNAVEVISRNGIVPDVLHIDAAHDFSSIFSDLQKWWPIVRAGGALIGDDYHPTGIDVWPEVRAAFHDYFKTNHIDNFGGKCVVSKGLDGEAHCTTHNG